MTDCIVSWRRPGGNGYPSQAPHVTICHEVHGPKPSPVHEVRHVCGNRLCVNPFHLTWGTRQENTLDTRDHGRVPNQKLDWETVNMIRYRYNQGGITQRELADEYGVSKPCIGSIIRNRTWRHEAHGVITEGSPS